MTSIIPDDYHKESYYVLDEDGHVIGTIELNTSPHSVAKYSAYKGDRYLGQAETTDYILNHYFC